MTTTLNDTIRAVFLAHGFTIKDGQTDLKPYVYEAVHALLSKLRAPVAGERAAFEAAYAEMLNGRSTPPTFAAFMRDPDDSYSLPIVERAWAMWQARAALASAPVAGEAVAWMHAEDPARVVSALQKATSERDGGAYASSLRPYTIALGRLAPTQASEAVRTVETAKGEGDVELCGLPIKHEWASLISDSFAKALRDWAHAYARASVLAESQQHVGDADDAARWRWATTVDENAETLHSIVVCHGGDQQKINERADFYRAALSAQSVAQKDGDDKWKPQTPQQIAADMRNLARSEGFDWPDPDSAQPGAQRTGGSDAE